MFEKAAGVSVKASGQDLAEIYSIKFVRDTMRIRSPDTTTVSVSRNCESAFAALAVFAPTGVGTIDCHSNLALIEVATGRTVEFSAHQVLDIANLVSAFAISRNTASTTGEDAVPLSDAVFGSPPQNIATVPTWITENPDFKPTLVEDDGRLVLSFAPLRVSAKSKYLVEGRSESGAPDYWGYEVSADGRPFGFVALLEPGTVLVTGVEAQKYSKHRNIRSAMFRLSSHIASLRSE
jgi:hypothetical protein